MLLVVASVNVQTVIMLRNRCCILSLNNISETELDDQKQMILSLLKKAYVFVALLFGLVFHME